MTALPKDLSGFSMAELFRLDVDEQSAVLTKGLLAAERGAAVTEQLDGLMRAAHSIKGAARVVDNEGAVHVAHAMEDLFLAAQRPGFQLTPEHVDLLLRGVDMLGRLSRLASAKGMSPPPDALQLGAALRRATSGEGAAPIVADAGPPAPPAAEALGGHDDLAVSTVRVSANHLNRLLGLAGEAVVASRWPATFGRELLTLKQGQQRALRALEQARAGGERMADQLQEAQAELLASQDQLLRCLASLDGFDRRVLHVSHELYEEVLAARMRPLGDVTDGVSRMVRDLARDLGKQARLEVVGEATPVDRDILRRLDAPLVHLLRNALDHGIESPEERRRVGKPAEGCIRVEAAHRMGVLVVSVVDDGRGVDAETIRRHAVSRGLVTEDVAARLDRAELLEFLFLPGFSTRAGVSEISGRGVGLDVVRTMIRDVGGRLEATSEPGQGTRFQLQLPLTLSVLRALLVRVGEEPYAIPLTRVSRVVKIPRSAVHSVEGREHFFLGDQVIGLMGARDVLRVGGSPSLADELSVVILNDHPAEYGLVVDTMLGQGELVVRQLDRRLGKLANIQAAALLPDGAPVLILDVDDLVRSTGALASGGRLESVRSMPAPALAAPRPRRILVADDSITVRETERKLLQAAGYDVDVAVDGMEAWNAIRAGEYDLLLTDVDMPRLDGIELTRLVRADHRLRHLPVMIVSYKDREEDRLRGLGAGADYYLTKASFHDDTLLDAAASLLAAAT